ncbi:Fibronectin type III domain protein [Labilithrix luteola]|uniref:Fibronectin type III domain protein n=1 Tax=Labilithrix luteola TaxID=1391654 RepID=A0A0K1QA21_9BACT|nr:Ig-like domain-containing protein [Labilithrix luteola]AKV02641.1 Fibronectin type III domain protein [Labilithrix luteola]
MHSTWVRRGRLASLFSLLLPCALTLGIAACGDDQEASPPPEVAAEAPDAAPSSSDDASPTPDVGSQDATPDACDDANACAPVTPPVAHPVTASIMAGTIDAPITLNITGGAPTSVAVPTSPSHGTVNVGSTSITYTPTTGYTGLDSFPYTATNAGGTSAPATVSVTVNPLPPAPIAHSVGETIPRNSTKTPITLNITGGPPTSVSVLTGPSHGTVDVVGTGITYTPTTGYTGLDSFTYTATNAGGTSAPATVSITVSP